MKNLSTEHARRFEEQEMGSRGTCTASWCCWCLLLFLCLSIGCCKKKPKLEITTESKPDDCTQFAEIGDRLTVHYTGAFTNGKVFDSSLQREPFTIQLGAKQVIPGWEEGLLGMCEGEKRKLKIPPHLAYGERGVEGAIPGGATLLFSVELLELKKPSLLTWNRDTFTILGVVVLLGMLGYEVFRRYKKESTDMKDQKKSVKKGNKKRR